MWLLKCANVDLPPALPLAAPMVGYNRRLDSTQFKTGNAMEAERINALSALLNDLTGREAELRRYL